MTHAPAEAGRAVVEGFDTGTHAAFYDYYAKYSESPAALQRFAGIAEAILRMRGPLAPGVALDVLDVGCNAGTQSRLWCGSNGAGHRYVGIDINAPLVQLARERAAAEASPARFEVGSATALPFADASFDICLVPELLEHVEDWQSCVNEAARVLRPGGLMYLSTTNWLCPKQQEFNLPAYSWYPGFVKRDIERRAVTDWPAVANHAKYPAVHWFSYYGLRRYLASRGFECFDRFDIMRMDNKSPLQRSIVGALRRLAPLRLLGHVLTPGTSLVARKRA
jgi:2-polyprenyl-6-hydroxyphenyl methylase/3-demethylubiquinone-9 3-methyltransferase